MNKKIHIKKTARKLKKTTRKFNKLQWYTYLLYWKSVNLFKDALSGVNAEFLTSLVGTSFFDDQP